MGLEDLKPIFGRVVACPYSSSSEPTPEPVPFIFYVYVLAGDELQVVVSDFRSNTFRGRMTRNQLENLRDDIGISGSWPDFVDYFTTSLRSDVKLDIQAHGRLIAQKAKGLPRISIHLNRVLSQDSEARANLALKLYEEFNNVQRLLGEEKATNHQLTKDLAAEQEKSSSLRAQLDMVISPRKRNSLKINNTEKTDVLVSQDSPGKTRSPNLTDKQFAESPTTKKGNYRIVPAYRRSKLRGAILHDVDDA